MRPMIERKANILDGGCMKNERKRQLLAALQYLERNQITQDMTSRTPEALEARRAVLAMLRGTSATPSAPTQEGQTTRLR